MNQVVLLARQQFTAKSILLFGAAKARIAVGRISNGYMVSRRTFDWYPNSRFGRGPTFRRRRASGMKTISAANYRNDKLFAGVARAVAEILAAGNFVAPVDVLHTARPAHEERLRGLAVRPNSLPGAEVPSETFAKLNRILRILDLHCRSMGLKPSPTAYHKWGAAANGRIAIFENRRSHTWKPLIPDTTSPSARPDNTADETGHDPAMHRGEVGGASDPRPFPMARNPKSRGRLRSRTMAVREVTSRSLGSKRQSNVLAS